MVGLQQDERGNCIARKHLPNDVREECGRLYGQSHEAKFFAAASDAERRFHLWLAEVEAQIANILAQRRREGIALTANRSALKAALRLGDTSKPDYATRLLGPLALRAHGSRGRRDNALARLRRHFNARQRRQKAFSFRVSASNLGTDFHLSRHERSSH
jgi:hypothetical protein